jgi:hypothetical protein
VRPTRTHAVHAPWRVALQSQITTQRRRDRAVSLAAAMNVRKLDEKTLEKGPPTSLAGRGSGRQYLDWLTEQIQEFILAPAINSKALCIAERPCARQRCMRHSARSASFSICGVVNWIERSDATRSVRVGARYQVGTLNHGCSLVLISQNNNQNLRRH